ncbi:uncharacterized protein G2W53_032634 [Senna tora]|uniref:Uncharacterized protein n=1 Tax=Senna tora TaxID=362788 RepID=A0A834SWA4_9FABA|nr:uncharacterized protein G2W53_032634 [Senna tora]
MSKARDHHQTKLTVATLEDEEDTPWGHDTN